MSRFSERHERHFMRHRHKYHHHPAGRVLGGFVFILVGLVFFLKTMGVFFPDWLFSWPMLLITIGVFVGARHLFRGAGWIVMILVGGAFLIDRTIPDLSLTKFVWPAVIILIGLSMMVGSRKRWRGKKWGEWKEWNDESFSGDVSSEDRIYSHSVFSAVKKNIISKNFKGGEISCVFGGAEINLSQADFEGTIEIELSQVFGGAKLIVPSNWKIKHETSAVFGGIEDNRPQNPGMEDSTKVLILKGSVVFGGVEITNH
jgi:predicted membrane protein